MLGLRCCAGYFLVVVSMGYFGCDAWAFSLWWLLLLGSMGLRALQLPYLWLLASRTQAQELWCTGLAACSMACGVFPDPSNLRLLHRQADSLSLSHQGSSAGRFLTTRLPGKSLIKFPRQHPEWIGKKNHNCLMMSALSARGKGVTWTKVLTLS